MTIHNRPAHSSLFRHESGSLCLQWEDGGVSFQAVLLPTSTKEEYQVGEPVRAEGFAEDGWEEVD